MSEDFTELVDLAAERIGGRVLCANDEFFAPKENLLKASAPRWIEDEYTDRGKWMDGWETRRRRSPGYDWCVIRLGMPGVIRGVVVDTAYFRGNYPEACSIEAASLTGYPSPDELVAEEVVWSEILPRSALSGDSQNRFAVDSPPRWTHVRFNIYPDGGVARLRVYGEVLPNWQQLARSAGQIDLAAAENGGFVLTCSDMFFGPRHNLIMPGLARNMGDGWETRRRRGPGHDWAMLALAAQGTVERVEVDTSHFKGNAPGACSIEVSPDPNQTLDDLVSSDAWVELLPTTRLQPDTRHVFEQELAACGPAAYLRLHLYPDGGVARLRVWGRPTRAGWLHAGLGRLNALPVPAAAAELLACCGSRRWAYEVAERRPFDSEAALLTAADDVWRGLEPSEWLEAFKHHPRIGEKAAEAEQTGTERGWSAQEQAGTAAAAADTMVALAAANRDYEAKFGYVFLVNATSKSAEEMLALARQRLENAPGGEIRVAAEQQRQITHIRLEKLLLS